MGYFQVVYRPLLQFHNNLNFVYFLFQFKSRNLEFKEYQNEQLEKYNQLMQQKDELHTSLLDSNLQISQLKSKISMLEVKLSDFEFKKVTEQNSLAMQSNTINDQQQQQQYHKQQPPPPYVVERFDVEQQTDAIDILQNIGYSLPPSIISSGNNNNNDDESLSSNSVTTVKYNDDHDVDDYDETTADQSICSTEMSSVNGDIILQHQSIPLDKMSTVDSIDILEQCDHIERIIENDIKLMTDPDIQREEELILFKEQCAKLSEENVHLKMQINDVLMKTNGISINSLLAIGVPLFAVIIYLFISPYL